MIGTVGDNTAAIVIGAGRLLLVRGRARPRVRGRSPSGRTATGLQVVSTASQVVGDGLQSVAVSPDGTKVLFYDNMNAAGNAATLTLAGTDGPDGATGKIALTPSLNIGDTGCFPVFAFAGSDVAAVYEVAGALGWRDQLRRWWKRSPLHRDAQHVSRARATPPLRSTTRMRSAPSRSTRRAPTLPLFDELRALAHGRSRPAPTVAIDPAGVFGQFSAASDGGLSVVYTDTTRMRSRWPT